MRKYIAISMVLFGFTVSSQGIITNSIQFGGDGSDKNWAYNVVTNDLVTPTEYSVSYGSPARYAESPISNLQFTVTFTETNGVPVYIAPNWLGAGATYDSEPTNSANRRITGDQVIQLKVSYSGDNGKLLSLKTTGFGTQWNTQPYETLVFSDGINNFSLTDTANDFIQDYDASGLDPLTLNNTGTWVMYVSADDVLGGGTNFTESGMGALVLEYIADVDYVEPNVPLTPAVFEFVDNGEMDSGVIGTTMTRSNSWDTAITITTVDIIGQDLTLASAGTANKTWVNTNPGNALGINSSNNGIYSNESRDFNPNEAWVLNFDSDVYLNEIDFASMAVDGEMTISSEAFTNIVLFGEGDDNSDGTFSLSDTFLPAGTNIMIQMTSTTNASDTSIRIAYIAVQSVSDQNSYQAWVSDENLVAEINDAYGDDPDSDSMDNLLEFALGSDPLVNDAASYLPTTDSDGGTDYLNYVYRRRIRYADSGLDYTVGSTLNLTTEEEPGATEEVGAGAIDATFESVTNRVPTAAEDQQFMQLKVTID
ncbi:hypothetical protein P4C99_03965 [Pontiellaceae bacterium B1224]|nr:hypothetical protein [Pontiellaceae bacterium B1224]